MFEAYECWILLITLRLTYARALLLTITNKRPSDTYDFKICILITYQNYIFVIILLSISFYEKKPNLVLWRIAGRQQREMSNNNFMGRNHCSPSNMNSAWDIFHWLRIVSSLNIPGDQGAVSIRKMVLPGMAIPMLKIRRPNGRLIFNMEITIRR